jgi:preprotein translocase subunit YajC
MLYFLETTGTDPNPISSLIGTGAMLLFMIGIFYFMLIRPENKKKKETEKMRSSTKVGDKITTIGGIVGTIVQVKDDKLVIETSADQVRMELMKWSISSNESAAERAAEEAKKEQEIKAKAKAVKNMDKEKK